MTSQDLLTTDVLDWLMEKSDPGIRYLVQRDLLDHQPDNKKLSSARVEAYTKGPIATILAEMNDEGYWDGLLPKISRNGLVTHLTCPTGSIHRPR